MPAAQRTIIAGDPKPVTKSWRKPLQPKNIFLATENVTKPKQREPTRETTIFSLDGESNKENLPIDKAPAQIQIHQSIDASLAEELSAIRKKLERLRGDRERTEEMLKERDRAIDLQRREILNRGEIQKMLEIEVDRLFRLKEIHSYSMRISPIKTLREKEEEKRNNSGFARSLELETENMEESEGENILKSPSSASSEEITKEKR